MKAKKSNIVSGMTQGAKILKAISDAVRQRGGDDSNLLKVLKNPSCTSKIAGLLTTDGKFMDEKIQVEFFKFLVMYRDITEEDMKRVLEGGLIDRIVDVIKTARPRETYPVKIDYRLPINLMINEGNLVHKPYDWSRFYTFDKDMGEVCVELEIIHLGGYESGVTSDEAISVLDMRGYRPANVAELIAYASTYTHKGSWGDFVALGSSIQVGEQIRVPVYRRGPTVWESGFQLEYDYRGTRNWDSFGFLAVKK